jgi:hypothetical protein
VKYPANIVLDNGWARIHEGHGLPVGELREDLVQNLGSPIDGQELCTEEIHFGYVPSIKWCGDYGACEQEGEWHSHWYQERPGDDNRFTIVYWLLATRPGGPACLTQGRTIGIRIT